MKPKVLVILGTTSTGKSDLAVHIAKKVFFNKAEIISADSRQVYKDLNLGTGKVTKKEMRGVPHHLLDVINPKKTFSVTQFKKLAERKIKEILARNNVPIICGGSGFYIEAIVADKTFPEVPPNKELRKKLETKSPVELINILKKLDEERAKDIERKNEINNKIRLIRAIEIASELGKVPKVKLNAPNYNFVKVGLTLSDQELKNKISDRLLKRIKGGMIKEAETLHKNGLSLKRMGELGLEYKFLAFYLNKKITKHELIINLEKEIWQYAKRQKTWFKRDKEIYWYNPKDGEKIEDFIASSFEKSPPTPVIRKSKRRSR